MTVRKLRFSGAWFDGKSSTKHLVDVELTPQEVILKPSEGEPVRWDYTHLRWTAKTSPFYIEHRVSNENGELLETLVVEDPVFYESFSKIAPEIFSISEKESNYNWKLYSVGVLVLLFSAYVLIRAIPSFLADEMIDKIPVEWEVTMGQSILSMLPVEEEPNPEILMVLQGTVDLLKQSLGNSPYDLKVYILPVKQANALALPGGPIVVFEGLLHEADSPEELAGVLAHEIQHIVLRHSTRGIIRNFSEKFMATLILGDVNAVLEGILQLTGELETLGLSRKMEAEADKKGMELILSSKINPNGMIRIFKKLTHEDSLKVNDSVTIAEEGDMKFSSYFSSHPSGRNRLAHLEQQMKPYDNKTWMPLFPKLDWNAIKLEN
jgi:beta-barrel assembly-enhancing protease